MNLKEILAALGFVEGTTTMIGENTYTYYRFAAEGCYNAHNRTMVVYNWESMETALEKARQVIYTCGSDYNQHTIRRALGL